MELLESLLVNKKNFKILATIYILIVIVILVWIWWPEKTANVAKYEPYDETSKNKEMVEYYARFLESIKQYNDVEALEDYFDYNYLEYNDTSIAGVMWELKSTAGSYVLDTFDVYKNGDKFIYSITIPNNDGELKVNFVEKEYPYNFSITYDTFVNYSSMMYYGRVENATLNVTGTYQDLNYIEYELTVTNNAYDKLEINFTKADNMYLSLENGNNVSLNLTQSTQDKVVVEKGQTIPVKLVFNVGIAEQSNISSLNITKIYNGSSNLTTTILF